MSNIMNMEELGIINDMPNGWVYGINQPLWHKKVYQMWFGMWRRVKDENYIKRDCYKNCNIYEDFKYLSKYVEWIMQEPRFEEFTQTCNEVRWVIDKDEKNPNDRNYYTKCMTLTTQSENCKERNDRRGTTLSKIPIIAIDNNKILLFKSTFDAQNKGFDRRHISRCIDKKNKHHKGYKWYKVNYKHNLRLRKI